jgi:hypothetical protein
MAWRQPSIVLAEMTWRWTFGLAAFLLVMAFLLEYAHSLPVTTLDRLLLASRQPVFAMEAVRRIFAGSAYRFTTAGVVLSISLTLGWIVLASLARLATLNALIEEYDFESPSRFTRKAFVSLIALNFLRAATALAVVVGIGGAAIAASSVWASTHIAIADAARLWAVLVFCAVMAWTTLNWFLSTASVFVVAEPNSALSAIASTATFCLNHAASALAIGSFFELLHLGAFISALGFAFVLFAATSAFDPGLALFVVTLVALLYFGAADFLYIGRLAAYLRVLRGEEPAHAAGPETVPEGPASVDQSELILSDMPLPAT